MLAAEAIWCAWTAGVLLDELPFDVRPHDADEGLRHSRHWRRWLEHGKVGKSLPPQPPARRTSG
jgi:hypothetical protein